MSEQAGIYKVERRLNDKTPIKTNSSAIDLQTLMLKQLLGKTVTVYMMNGIRLEGKLTGYDQFTLILDYQSLLYKHAISTILQGTTRNQKYKEK